MIKEFQPNSRRVAVLWDRDNPYSALATRQITAAAKQLDVEITLLRVAEPAHLDVAFATMAAERPDALLVPAYLVLVEERARIVRFAAENRIPAIYSQEEFVRAGGLISYGVELGSLYKRAATYVDKIIKGESRPTCRSSSRRHSSSPSTSRPPRRSASRCRPRCSPAPTR